jgi:hypothetical protein
MILRRCQPTESRLAREWIKVHHYTKAAPPGFVVVLEFLEGKEVWGAMMLGRPTARAFDSKTWLELTRMYFVDHAPKNTESQALGMMRRWVRTWMPETRMLLAYSDPAAGHTGTVYQADNWACMGQTKLNHIGWRNRPGRRGDESPSRKTRWIRTP